MNHAATLKLSLLVSLGIVPVACGGASRRGNDDVSGAGGTSSGGGVGAGASSKGGSFSAAGTSAKGGSVGMAGTTSKGGGPGLAGAGGGGQLPGCTSPVVDAVTGLVTCAEGYQHRPTAVTCQVVPAGAAGGAGGEAGAGAEADRLPRATGDVLCGEDDPSVCSGFALGYCGALGQTLVCLSGCRVDADCGGSAVCVCQGASATGGVCRRAVCQIDSDCESGSRCASHDGTCEDPGFACQGPLDECVSQADCGGHCIWDPTLGKRYCESLTCGRPFLVEAEARVAPVVAGREWLALHDAAPRVDHLTSSERAALAEHWARMGQMEHASIAAFARFSLQLLSLGAPPELVEACTGALSDETAHARLCFRIASAYAGRAVGPGPLDVSGSLLETSLSDIVELVIAEGCFGETSAALEALEAAGSASDPVIVAAYERIAADEQRHAELAFRFVRWALAQAPQAVAERISRAIAAPPKRTPSALSVTLPCLQALLGA